MSECECETAPPCCPSAELQLLTSQRAPDRLCVRMKALKANFTSRLSPPGPVPGLPGVPPAWSGCEQLRHGGSSGSLRGGFRCPSVCWRMASDFQRIPSTAGPPSPENTRGCRAQASGRLRTASTVSSGESPRVVCFFFACLCVFYSCGCAGLGGGRGCVSPPAPGGLLRSGGSAPRRSLASDLRPGAGAFQKATSIHPPSPV